MVSYHIPSHVHYRSVGDEVVILDDRTDEYLGLNESAARIWLALAGGSSLDDAVSALVMSLDVSPEVAGADARRLVDQLVDRGLLEVGSI